ncbi:hypothetical protein M5R23_05890 [Citrobacter freundii]|uniref:hypothetical protein n=1 Tax=Citrobacter freundii TaxID=546 RepID=UPI001A2B8A2B|nr:hypothetical protein [Citrobacter freundii]MCO8024931.1 hypothetical protein [Citrobacter freundii]MCO8032407.1 hypothetical protein [Citrobacter freundii]MCO8037755.1 hypothetical protein [Citrobacter freundii]MCS0561107.1 hypothetical protein [Citrobacter freundii]HAU5610520.1 hypothetical protein [Citrobacter freundii]
MEKYLYLTRVEWISPWVDGGMVPLEKASKYKSIERNGTLTPDENLIDTSSHHLESMLGSMFDLQGGSIKMEGCRNQRGPLPDMFFHRRVEDGLVFCLANRRSNFIAKKLNKVACVKILDIEKLKACLDEQIGIVSTMGQCSYTKSHERNHFVKSFLDSWQDEFRLFWPNAESTNVEIPKNTAIPIPIRGQRY